MSLENKINPEYENLFSFNTKEEEIEHEAKMLMFQFLDKIQKAAEDKNLNRKKIAQLLGTSASYITQLFRGDKLINLTTLAKFQKALNLKFEIHTNTQQRRKTETEQDISVYLNKIVKDHKGDLLLLTENKKKAIDFDKLKDQKQKISA